MKMQSTSISYWYNRTALLIFSLLFSAIAANAQGFSITAKVVDKNKTPLSGEALVLNPSDSSLVKGAPIVKGFLQIDEVPMGASYLLKLSADGHADQYLTISPKGYELNLGELTMEIITLQKDVTVITKAKIFRKTAEGGTRMSVEQTMLGNSISSKEILAKSPGVSIVGNRVFLFGRGEALLLLNGKQIAYERLSSIPVSAIKEVEIIPNPSAKYDAQGRAVINFIVKKNDIQGFTGNITHHSTFARYYFPSFLTDITYRKNKMNFTLGYDPGNFGKHWNRTVGDYEYAYPSGNYSTHSSYEAYISVPASHTYRFGMSYDINDKSDISVQYDGVHSLNLLKIHVDNVYWDPSGKATDIFVRNNGSTRQKNNSVNINYNQRLDTLGSTFFIGGQKNWYINNLYDQIRQEVKFPVFNSYRNNTTKNIIELTTAQTDWSKMFRNGSRFEAGLKYANAETRSTVNVIYRPETNENWTPIEELRNDFKYSEKVSAMYTQYSGKLNRNWSYVAGIRAEYSDVTGIPKSGKKVIDSSYFNLFPNIKIDQKINDNWSIAYNFSKHITRPYYQDLDPFLWYQDSLTIWAGNPYLIPELITAFDITVSYKNYSFRAGYSRGNNSSFIFPIKGNTGPNSIHIYRENMKHLDIWSASVDANFEKGLFSSYNKVAINYRKIYDDRPLFEVTQKLLPQVYVYSYNQLKIPKVFTVDFTLDYLSKQSAGITVLYPFWYATVGVQRNFFKNKLNARLMYNDIFRSFVLIGERNLGGIKARTDQRGNQHLGRITLIYKFGGLKAANYKNKNVNENEFNRIRR
ncbi:MAG: outer membrane beta-barrel protein [Dinghuibacter sp.]|nr:outer membrane beta-barrel protein [Dinghuibacter sp.]